MLLFFQQVSVVGFLANLVAIPLVTLLVTPLALLGVLLPPAWTLAAALVLFSRWDPSRPLADPLCGYAYEQIDQFIIRGDP